MKNDKSMADAMKAIRGINKQQPETIKVTDTVIQEDKPKRKVGRPKTRKEETKTVNVAIPVSVLEQIDVAKCKYGNSLTAYINAVVAADLKENFSKYKTIYDMIHN